MKAIQLPEATDQATLERLRAKAGELGGTRAPAWVNALAVAIARHVKGENQDFGQVPLDLEALPPFHKKVYAAARKVGTSRTVTYGELAALAGKPGGARAVGQAMRRNPFPIVVPCHRIVAAGGKPGGFTSWNGLDTKARLLAAEGVTLSLFRGKGGLSFDWDEAVRTVSAADPLLAKLIEKVPGKRLELAELASPFESLLQAIVYQQLNGRAAATILGRVKALFPKGEPVPRALLRMKEEKLRGAGLSRSKLAAARDLAAKALDGTLPTAEALRNMPDEEIVERLTAVRGIGRWTAEMLLMFRLGRPDVLPATDYGVRKGFQRTFKKRALPEPKAILRHGEKWRPFRSVASWFLWRATEL
ncbi:MAG: methylated-DNA--[protein]-cysteine S-methyltransferase [Planctomycetota bacterium]